MKKSTGKQSSPFSGNGLSRTAMIFKIATVAGRKLTVPEHLFDWADDDYMWCEPDGNINHCTSNTYPLGKWFEVEHLSTNLTESKVIIEDHYSE